MPYFTILMQAQFFPTHPFDNKHNLLCYSPNVNESIRLPSCSQKRATLTTLWKASGWQLTTNYYLQQTYAYPLASCISNGYPLAFCIYQLIPNFAQRAYSWSKIIHGNWSEQISLEFSSFKVITVILRAVSPSIRAKSIREMSSTTGYNQSTGIKTLLQPQSIWKLPHVRMGQL